MTFKVLQYPDPRLRLKAEKVKAFSDEVQDIADKLLETMYAENGIGLSATQVDIQKSILVADVSQDRNQPMVLINAEIIASEGEEITEEGCLSVPGIYAEVKRAEKITVKAVDAKGEPVTVEADGILAVCIQHEMDHLKGKLFVDHLSSAKREQLLTELRKLRAENKVVKRDKVPYQLSA